MSADTPKWETELDAVLHACLSIGSIAANIFVKNPAHRQQAGQILVGVNQALPVIDSLLGQQPQQPPSVQNSAS